MEIKPIPKDDIYNESNIQNYLEDDEISATEEGFMMGYMAA